MILAHAPRYAVVTRAAAGAAPYAQALAALGIEAVALELTRTEPAADPDALGRALHAGGFDAIVVASARAARAVIAASAPIGEIWAVGPATAAVLADAGITVRLPTTGADAIAVARAVLVAHPAPGLRVLVPRAEEGRDAAIALLRAAGAHVAEVIAYRTVPIAVAPGERGLTLLASGDAMLCVVFAPSQVAALAAIVPLAGLTARFVAIGETTAAALRDAGIIDVLVAATPTPAGIANAVAAVYPARR